MKLGDCGDDGGDRNENDLNDGRNVVDNSELKGPKSGLRVCAAVVVIISREFSGYGDICHVKCGEKLFTRNMVRSYSREIWWETIAREICG